MVCKTITRGHSATTEQHTPNPIQKQAKDMDRRFSKEDVPVASKTMKGCLMSLAVGDMHIKTTMGCHLPPLRMVTIKT